jgi:integrase
MGKPVKMKSKKWYARVKDPKTGKWKKVPLSTDKQAARKMLADLETKLARGEAGLFDPHNDTKSAPIGDLICAYLNDLAERGKSARYRQQTERLLKTVCTTQVHTLDDLTPDYLDAFLSGLTCSARTKNTYRQACLGMCNYLVGKKKLDNPLRLTTRRNGEVMRKRRALTPENLQKLLTAARQRPFIEQMTIRRGKNKGQLAQKVKPAIRQRLEATGRHRALLYLTAVHTGLRLGSLRKMKVCYLDLDSAACGLYLPAEIMKNRKPFTQPLRADLVAELKAWIQDTGRQPSDLVFDVRSHVQMSKLLKKDLAFAGIPYRDVKGRVFDFHSFRKCKGSFLRQAGVDPAVSMQQLGHTDIRLTMEVYNDEELLLSDEALAATPPLTIR